MKLGINALNILSGGGLTYIYNLINNFDKKKSSFDQIVIWGNKKNLGKLPDKSYIKKVNVNKSRLPFFDFFWSLFLLEKYSKKECCNVTFCPAATSLFFSKKLVVANLNLLPFNFQQILKCGISILTVRLIMLRILNKISFKLASRVIFLTNYTKKKKFSNIKGTVIALGIDNKFDYKPHNKKFKKNKLTYFYNSTIFPYKNHLNVLKAFIEHIKIYPDNKLIILGDGPNIFKKKIINQLKKIPKKNISYKSNVSFNKLLQLYKNSDVKIFASSCEAFPNIILETIKSSLPLITSKIPQIKSIIQNKAVYFDEKNYLDILYCMNKIVDINLRKKIAKEAYYFSKKFSWKKMATKTFKVLEQNS